MRVRSFAWMLLFAALTLPACDSYSKEQEEEMRAIRDRVTQHPETINALDERGHTPLDLAVINNYLPLMDWLGAHGANPNVKGRFGDTPLHVAIILDRTSDTRVIRKLLAMGADVNAANNYGDTPLHRAAYHGLTDRVQVLLENKADVTARAQRGETPLLYAVRPEGHPDTISVLLNAGADANAVDTAGMTPLHAAAMMGDVDVATILIEKGRADLNRQTSDGYTPLHIAATFGKPDVVRLLLTKGAKRNLTDKRNLTPLDVAIRFPAMSYAKDGKRPVDTSSVVRVLKAN